MKKIVVLLGVAIMMLVGCQEKQTRYTQSSAEIDSYKAALSNYENGDWEGYMSHFADTAKIYHNSGEKFITPKESAMNFEESLKMFSSYGFADDKGEIEMVVTDKGDTWVNFWGRWEATLAANGQKFQTEVHTTVQFVDGKIVKEYGYWDTAPLMMALMELEKSEAAKADGEPSLTE